MTGSCGTGPEPGERNRYPQQAIGIDLSDYAKMKAEGFSKMVKLGGQAHIIQVDNRTGKAVAPMVIPLDKEKLLAEKVKLEDACASVDAIVAEMDSATEVATEA